MFNFVSLLVRELLAMFLFFAQSSITEHFCATAENISTRAHIRTGVRTLASHVHLQTHEHARNCIHTRTQIDATTRKRTHTLINARSRGQHIRTHVQTHASTTARLHTGKRVHTHAQIHTHTPCYRICYILKSLKHGKKLIAKDS